MPRYRLKGKPDVYTKEQIIQVISTKLKATIISPNVDDEMIITLGGEVVDDEVEISGSESNPHLYRLRLERNRLLADTDWVEKSTIVPKPVRDKYIAWRQLLRDIFVLCPGISILPPAPELNTKTKRLEQKTLTEAQVEAIKNHKTKDESWLLFLDYWEHTGYTNNTSAVKLLATVYSSEKIDEIVNGI